MALESEDEEITVQSSNLALGERLPEHARESVRTVAASTSAASRPRLSTSIATGRSSLVAAASLSGGSRAARGVSDADLRGVAYEKGAPPTLARLVMECERAIVY